MVTIPQQDGFLLILLLQKNCMRMIKQIILSLIFSSMLLATTSSMAESNILTFTNPSVIEIESGNVVNIVTIGEQYLIQSDFLNPQTTEQSFVYIVDITNVVNNTELSNALLEGIFAPGEKFTPSLTWEPPICGDLIANFTVYDNLQDKNLLAKPLSMPIIVEGCMSKESSLDEFFFSIQNFFANLFV